jgi:hypothetical protein
MKADYLVWGLLAAYIAATLMYATERNWPKMLYFSGSAIITLGILMS